MAVCPPHEPPVDSAVGTGGLPARLTGLLARFTRFGLVDRQGPSPQLRALDALNGGFGSGAVGHLDETKTTGLPRVTISNDTDFVHRTIRFEELAEVVSRRSKRNIRP